MRSPKADPRPGCSGEVLSRTAHHVEREEDDPQGVLRQRTLGATDSAPCTSPHSDVGRTGPIPGLSGGSWPRILRRYLANISTPSESDPGLQRVHRSAYSPMTSRSWSSRATARETQTPPR